MSSAIAIDLYIFVTSDTPDLYINIIGYCIDHYSIKKIIFLGIVEDKGQRERIKNSLTIIKDRVKRQLALLQEGQYLYREQSTGHWKERTIEIESFDKRRYGRIADQDITIQVITYDTLDTEITNYAQEGACIFDVSGVLKGFLIDVYTLLLLKKVESIFVFELRIPRTFDEKELIHNLSLDRRDYEYVNITKSQYTSNTLVKTKTQETMDRNNLISSSQLIEALANEFARDVLILYGILVASVIIWSSIHISRGGWDQLEPLTFLLLTLIPYLVSIIISIFSQQELSVNPKLLRKWLTNYRYQSLQRRFLGK